MNRRGFMKFFGIGTAIAAVSPSVLAEAPIMVARMPDCNINKRSRWNGMASGMAVNPGQSLGVAIDGRGCKRITGKWDEVAKIWVV